MNKIASTRSLSKPAESTESRGPTGIDRRDIIINQAARLFAVNGFDGASMRDIAAVTGIHAGSLYYHFTSKQVLFVAVHEAGMKVLTDAVQDATRDVKDPWERLCAAAAAHCTALLNSGDLMVMVVPSFPASIAEHRAELVRQRDAYEKIFAGLIAELKLPKSVDRRLLRLQLLGSLNWVQTWYRRDAKLSPAAIGRQFVEMLRQG